MRSALVADSRLEAVAGSPAAVRTTSGVTALTPGTAFDGRTLYVVYNVLTTASAYAAVAMLGDPPPAGDGGTAGITFQHAAAGSTSDLARFDTLAGAVNQGTPGPNGLRTVGKHVAAVVLNTGAASGIAQIDGSADVTKAFTAGSGIPDASLRLQATTANDAPLAAYAWLAPHSRDTRLRILHWLQVRYATTPF